MNIYIDFDDCLCETARHFSGLVYEMFGIDVPYEEIRYFDLQRSFALEDDQFERMMRRAHTPEVLLSYEETPGAGKVINRWLDGGHAVFIITGRPYSAYGPSRDWLDRHGLEAAKLYCFDKYGRDNFIRNSSFSLKPEDYYRMHFDYAIEDSPLAFKFFDHLPGLKVMVYDRPWNEGCEFPGENYCRCHDWEMISKLVDGG